MIIIKGTDEYTYKDIPDTVADKFTVEGGKQPFELSSILPNENQNAAIVNEVVDKFTKLGADRDKLKALWELQVKLTLMQFSRMYKIIIQFYKMPNSLLLYYLCSQKNPSQAVQSK